MRKYIVFVMITFCMFLSLDFLGGCAGHHCISIGGEYEGVNGNIEYCWDIDKTKKTGIPVLKDNKGKENYIISKDRVQTINNMLKDKKINASEYTDPIIDLLARIRRWQRDKNK